MDKEIIVNTTEVMPVLPLRGLVLFPGNVFHFDVGRKKSVLAINACIKQNQKVFLVPQKDLTVEEPTGNDFCSIGTVATVRQILKQSNEGIRVLVEGKYRGEINALISEKPYFKAEILKCEVTHNIKTIRVEALMRQIKIAFIEYSELVPKMAPDIIYAVKIENDPGKLADLVSSNLPFDYKDNQYIICEMNANKRIEKVFMLLVKEIELLKMENEINIRVRENIDENQKEYYLREQMKVISEELGDDTPQKEATELREKIINLHLKDDVSEKLLKECDSLFKMPAGSHEANVIRNHLDICLELPWNNSSDIEIDLKQTQKILDNEHYGLNKVKERIIETLAVKKLAPNIKGQILCLVGPPGVGKTSIAKSIAKSMGCKYTRIALGGVKDEAEIRGHRRTYVGSMPGRIISAVKSTGVKNPLILLDEVDKLSNDFRGDPTSALLEVLDSEQNNTFEDHYIDLPFDLSEVFFITTANDSSAIPEPLLDRMDLIEISSYTREEKFNIAKKHLLPKQMKKHGITAKEFRITDKAIRNIIDNYTREAGVRNLERTLTSVLRKTAKRIVEGEENKIVADSKNLKDFLGPEKYKDEGLDKKDQIGLVNGLAWTSVGGQTMQIEVAVMHGTGKLELTGSLGDVMKESAKAALSCIRMRVDKLDIDPNFYSKYDIHIHVPEGAVPKDGPSAGITMATALVSALSNRPVKHDLAMTGEITLRGRVMPIGGLREKTMAAYKDKIKTVIIPNGNIADLSEIDERVRENISFLSVSDFDEVVDYAFGKLKKKVKKKIIKENKISKLEPIPTESKKSTTVYV